MELAGVEVNKEKIRFFEAQYLIEKQLLHKIFKDPQNKPLRMCRCQPPAPGGPAGSKTSAGNHYKIGSKMVNFASESSFCSQNKKNSLQISKR